MKWCHLQWPGFEVETAPCRIEGTKQFGIRVVSMKPKFPEVAHLDGKYFENVGDFLSLCTNAFTATKRYKTYNCDDLGVNEIPGPRRERLKAKPPRERLNGNGKPARERLPDAKPARVRVDPATFPKANGSGTLRPTRVRF
jgi:hypothetical protein